MTSFREALDLLCMDAAAAAKAFGLTPQTIRQMRLDVDNANYRRPPDGWQRVLADVARTQGKQLEKLSARLDREAGGP